MVRISANIWISVSLVRLGFPSRLQARKPLMLTVRTSHITGNGWVLRCVSIQAYLTYAVAFFRIATSILGRAFSARTRHLHLLRCHDLGAQPTQFVRIKHTAPVTQGLVAYPSFFATTPLLCPSFTRFIASSLNSAADSCFGNFSISPSPSKLNGVISLLLENEVSGKSNHRKMFQLRTQYISADA